MSEKIATREAYGKALAELGNVNDKVVVLDADLAGATMTKHFKAAHPERFFDCGIAEADMVDISAGLSTMGLVPFCSTFAMFGAGRAYEQIRNSIAYPRLNVKVIGSHGGLSVGEDGATHQCIEDYAIMRAIPNMMVVSPCGLMVSETLDAAKLLEAEGIHIAVINVHTIKPIDADCVSHWARKCGNVVTVEEHSVIGGLGDAVADVLMGKVNCRFRKIGINDQFGQSGKALEVLREYGLTADQIAARIKETL